MAEKIWERYDRNAFYNLSIVVICSMVCGLLFPKEGSHIEEFLLIWLGLLLFFNLIRLEYNDLLQIFTKPKILIFLSLIKLIIIPIMVFVLGNYVIYPKPSYDLLLSIVLLSGISTGLGSPFVVNFVGGKLPVVVGLIITTSLTVPFILPFLIYVVFNSHFSIPVGNMILVLSVALFIPLMTGHYIKKFVPGLIKKLDNKSSYPSYLFIFLINFGIFGKYSDFFLSSQLILFENIVIVFILYGGYSLIGYMTGRLLSLDKHEKISVLISMAYLNNMLVVVLAEQFFNRQIAALAAFYNIPYYMGILILRWIMKKNNL